MAFAYLRISRDDTHPEEPVVYVGKDPDDTMVRFLQCMEDEQQYVFQILSQKQPTVLCNTGLRNLMNSNDACYVCSTPFLPGDKICADHDHITGIYSFIYLTHICPSVPFSFFFCFFFFLGGGGEVLANSVDPDQTVPQKSGV